jgi:Mrp family chromosome partitioning ATPase
MFDNRLRSGEQLYRLFGLRTFAMLPLLPREIPLTAVENPVVTEPQSLFAEVARTLATEVDELAQGRQNQTVLVTSPLPGDGKSSVALTLAVASVSMGRSAIVVDFDLRRPGPSILRSIQASSGTPDLIELLTGTGDPRRLLPAENAEATTEKTAVVLSTRESVRNPGSLIRGWQVGRLLERLRDQYDLVVINAPAVLAVRDATTLSGIADSTLMVVHWGKTTVEQLRAAMKLLHTPVAGAVFNQVDYAEHARRGYGDAVQFYMGSASYYSDNFDEPRGWAGTVGSRIRGIFKRGTA